MNSFAKKILKLIFKFLYKIKVYNIEFIVVNKDINIYISFPPINIVNKEDIIINKLKNKLIIIIVFLLVKPSVLFLYILKIKYKLTTGITINIKINNTVSHILYLDNIIKAFIITNKFNNIANIIFILFFKKLLL